MMYRHLRPPRYHRPAAPPDDPHQPPTLIIIDLTHPHTLPMQHERSAYPNLDGFSINGMSTISDRLHRR
jgi:hypothetical protein